MIEVNIPMTIRWPPFLCLEGRNADRPTDQIDKSRTLTHSHGKDECKRRQITFLWQPTQHAVSKERALFHSESDREGNSVGRFDPRLLSFLRVPFNSLLEYWERQMARKTDQRWRETVSIQPPTEVLFRKEEKLFPSRSQSVLNSKLSCGQLNTVIFRCWS